jgi:hypothetical protein
VAHPVQVGATGRDQRRAIDRDVDVRLLLGDGNVRPEVAEALIRANFPAAVEVAA